MFRVLSAVALCVSAVVFAAPKMMEFKAPVRGVSGFAGVLANPKEKQPERNAAALALDDLLRSKGTPLADADAAVHLVLDALFTQMAAPTDIYVWDRDGSGPRGDIICRPRAMIYPGRVSLNYSQKYVKKLQGKRVDRGYLNNDCTTQVIAASTEDEFVEHTVKGWGLIIHSVLVSENVARVGVTLVSPGNSDSPTPKFERPAYLGFVKRAKETEPWALLSLEPLTSKDPKKQDLNIFTPDAKVTDAEKKLRLAVWLESVRALPSRTEFLPQERSIFFLEGNGPDALEAKDKPLLEAARTNESALVRAAVELKLMYLGSPAPKPEALSAVAEALQHRAAQALVVKALLPAVGNLDTGVPVSDAEKQEIQAQVVKTEKGVTASVKDARASQGWAKVVTQGLVWSSWLFRKTDKGPWALVGPIR